MKNILTNTAGKSNFHNISAPEESGSGNNRRNFLRKSAIGGLSLGSFIFSPIEDTLAEATSKVNRSSNPSDLKITDLRYATVQHLGRPVSILLIDTNQEIYGLGEVRDGGDVRNALMLKSRLIGQNPCNVEKIFKSIKAQGGHGRRGGGISGVEMALWDVAGKAYSAPCYQLLGGKYRDQIKLYADTHGDTDFDLIKEKVKHRVDVEGFTWLKMTRLFNVLKNTTDAYKHLNSNELTNSGIEKLVEYIHAIRETVGNQIHISVDHFGDKSVNNLIRLGKAFDPYRLAWLEEPVSWEMPNHLKAVKDAVDTPIATGENIFLKETFVELCDAQAVDIVHPDLATSGGLLETKKIGDYAQERGVQMALHYAGTPISFMANVHCAAATENCMVLEYHPEGEEIPEWTNMVKTTGSLPLITNGFANVSNAPGLGVELDEVEVKKLLHPSDKTYFAPTLEWNNWNG